jgi:hypothetical protein
MNLNEDQLVKLDCIRAHANYMSSRVPTAEAKAKFGELAELITSMLNPRDDLSNAEVAPLRKRAMDLLGEPGHEDNEVVSSAPGTLEAESSKPGPVHPVHGEHAKSSVLVGSIAKGSAIAGRIRRDLDPKPAVLDDDTVAAQLLGLATLTDTETGEVYTEDQRQARLLEAQIERDNIIAEIRQDIGIREGFEVKDDYSADWVGKRMAQLDADLLRLERNHQSNVNENRRKLQYLELKYGAQLRYWVRNNLVDGKKSIRLPHVTVGFRKTVGQYSIQDREMVDAFIGSLKPSELVKYGVTEKLERHWTSEPLKKLIINEKIQIPGYKFTPEDEFGSFSVNDPLAKKKDDKTDGQERGKERR